MGLFRSPKPEPYDHCHPAKLGYRGNPPEISVDDMERNRLYRLYLPLNLRYNTESDTLWVSRRHPVLYPWDGETPILMALQKIGSSGCLQLTACESALQYLFGERLIPFRRDNTWWAYVTRPLSRDEWAPINQIDYRADSDKRFYNYYDLYYDH